MQAHKRGRIIGASERQSVRAVARRDAPTLSRPNAPTLSRPNAPTLSRSNAPTLSVEELTTLKALEAIRPEWSSLWDRCEAATPFQSPDWLIPWWRHLGEGELMVLALRRNGRLVGIAPFVIYAEPHTSERKLFLLGTGVSDYLDVLFDRSAEAECLRAVIAHLEQQRHRWDRGELHQLPAHSPLRRAVLPEDWRAKFSPDEVCPMLELPRRVEGLSRCVPSRQLETLQYYRRRLARRGSAQIELAGRKNF